MVVNAALEGSGTICAIGAWRGTDWEGASTSIIASGFESLGSLDLKLDIVGGSFGFKYRSMG